MLCFKQAKDFAKKLHIKLSDSPTSERLNDTPMSLLRGDSPRETFKRMASFNLVGKGS